jgi:xylulokinase
MAEKTLLGLDLGTTGIKAAIFDAESGKPVASAVAAYALHHPHPGWAEQDPADWWNAAVQAIRSCLEQAEQAGYLASSIRGLGISGQMHGAVLLDASGQVLRPAIIWSDQRTQAECDQITQAVGAQRLIELVSNPALPGFTAPKILWVRNHEPFVWSQVRQVLLPKDWLRYRLTGVPGIEISDAAGTCLCDVAHGAWSQDVLAALDLDPTLLPPIVGAAKVAGFVTHEASTLTSLPEGLPVAGGGADNACAAVGAGIIRPGQALVSIGTSGVVLAFSDVPQVDRTGPVPRVHTFNHAVSGAWYLMGVTQAAGLSLRWVRDELGAAEREAALAEGRDVYDILAGEAGSAPPGSEGLVFLPYLQGERTPVLDSQARGGWIGLTARHTRSHLIRAVMEGVAFSLKECLDVLGSTGISITQIHATGGGARSPLWRQILADVFAQPLTPLATEEGPALGAAMLAGVASGVYPSIAEASERIVRLGEAVAPHERDAQTYSQLYAIYRDLYPALSAIMHRLAREDSA